MNTNVTNRSIFCSSLTGQNINYMKLTKILGFSSITLAIITVIAFFVLANPDIKKETTPLLSTVIPITMMLLVLLTLTVYFYFKGEKQEILNSQQLNPQNLVPRFAVPLPQLPIQALLRLDSFDSFDSGISNNETNSLSASSLSLDSGIQ